jgi:hypothetical protein
LLIATKIVKVLVPLSALHDMPFLIACVAEAMAEVALYSPSIRLAYSVCFLLSVYLAGRIVVAQLRGRTFSLADRRRTLACVALIAVGMAVPVIRQEATLVHLLASTLW